MSFAVTVETIGEVWDHPNADRLELAKVEGSAFQFVIGKGAYKVGDQVVYFPIDSILPVELSDKLGLTDKLSKGRVKTISLRKSVSQGVVVGLTELGIPEGIPSGSDLTVQLGVIKYEPPETFAKDANLKPLPGLVRVYDIEGAEKFQRIVDDYRNRQVIITEKVEGSHFAISLSRLDDIRIYQRRFEIIPQDGKDHTWWNTARAIGLIDKMRDLLALFAESVDFILLRGEIVGPGIQGNYYDLKNHDVYAFELETDGQPVSAFAFLMACKSVGIKTVPVLMDECRLDDFLAGKTIQEASNGQSVINPAKLREGVVVRPRVEQPDDNELGRIILKQRSPEYLAKTEH